jgi:hypothetical protein
LYDVKLSQRLKLINSSRADSHVNSLKSNVSGTISVPIIRAMIAREEFIFGTSLQTAYFCPSTCLYVPLFKIEVAFLFVDLHTTVTDKEIHFETDGFYVMS